MRKRENEFVEKVKRLQGSSRGTAESIRPSGRPHMATLLRKLIDRTLDEDLVVYNGDWMIRTRVCRQLEMEGYRLRWVSHEKTAVSLLDGWEYVLVPHLLWWRRRVRRPHRPRSQYLLKRLKTR